jgi:hypothetical protein
MQRRNGEEESMTVVRGAEETPLQTEHRQLGRTFAMTVVSAGYGVMTAGLAYLVFLFMRAGDNFRGGALVPAFATITAIVAGVGLVSLAW